MNIIFLILPWSNADLISSWQILIIISRFKGALSGALHFPDNFAWINIF